MVFTRIKKALTQPSDTSQQTVSPYILLVEDDPEQMSLLVMWAQAETSKLLNSDAISPRQKEEINRIKLIKANNSEALEQVVKKHKGAILALMDCNIPDTKNGVANDQFVKNNRKITGQHRSVDLVLEHIPSTQVTMISSLNRFDKLIQRHYQTTPDLHINFINKKNQKMISNNIGYYLRQYLKDIKE